MQDQAFADVFDALADTPGEAARFKFGADMLSALQERVAGWNLSPAAAAARLGVTRPHLAELQAGRLGRFTLDQLVALTAAAGLVLLVPRRGAKAAR